MRRLLTLLLLTIPLLCQAQPIRRSLLELEGARAVRFVATRAGMLVAVWNEGAALYRVNPDGTGGTKLLSSLDVDSVRPFAEGILLVRSTEASRGLPTVQLISFTKDSPISRTMYTAEREDVRLSAEPALAQDAVYVLASYPEGRELLLRVRLSGAVDWTRELDRNERVQILPISGGVLVRQDIREDASNGIPALWDITAFEDSGKIRWRYSYDRGQADTMAFLPPSRIAVLQGLDAATAMSRLRYIDARNGSTTVATLPAPVSEMRATPRGLLLTGALLDQPHAILIRTNGSTAWSRRLPLHTRSNEQLLDATITRTGELWMASSDPGWEDTRRFDYPITLLRTSAANPAAPPGCMDIDVAEAARLEHALARQSIHVHLVRQDVDRFSDSGCGSPSDPEYLQFLRELTGILGTEFTISEPIVISVGRNERAYLRVTYGAVSEARCCCSPCPSVGHLGYWTNTTSGAELGAHLRSEVRPHLRRIAALQSHFTLLTGEGLHVGASAEVGVGSDPSNIIGRAGPGPSDPELFGLLETSAAAIIREIEALPPGQLAAHRSRRAQLDISNRLLVLDEQSFGERFFADGASGTWPLGELRRAVRQLYDPAAVAEHDQ